MYGKWLYNGQLFMLTRLDIKNRIRSRVQVSLSEKASPFETEGTDKKVVIETIERIKRWPNSKGQTEVPQCEFVGDTAREQRK